MADFDFWRPRAIAIAALSFEVSHFVKEATHAWFSRALKFLFPASNPPLYDPISIKSEGAPPPKSIFPNSCDAAICRWPASVRQERRRSSTTQTNLRIYPYPIVWIPDSKTVFRSVVGVVKMDKAALRSFEIMLCKSLWDASEYARV